MISSEQIRAAIPFALNETHLPLPERKTGKVREWYTLNDQSKLFITTDRLSAFDRVLSCVPFKGQVLNQLSAWWFDITRDLVDNHMVSIPDPAALIARTVKRFPVEIRRARLHHRRHTTALWYRYSLGERAHLRLHLPRRIEERIRRCPNRSSARPQGRGWRARRAPHLRRSVENGLLDAATWEISSAALAVFARGQEIAARSAYPANTKYEMAFPLTGK